MWKNYQLEEGFCVCTPTVIKIEKKQKKTKTFDVSYLHHISFLSNLQSEL